ncbi:pilM family protein [Salmonella enterica subsp. enterica serovar Eastbourne]|nr:pilM family protein [Salmonella enterica subsp. enterica serovar Eastbourne]
MGFGYVIAALAMFLMLMTSSMTSTDQSRVAELQDGQDAGLLAADMLRTASAVNDWRYSHPLADGELDLTKFGIIPAPDPRIRAVVSNDRLWVWTADQQGLRPALNRLSSGSALALAVSGGHLLMSDGTDMNLALPAGVSEGNVVYLN